MMQDARSDAGFTLIELVIALSIVSLLSVMLIGGYTFASRAWNRVDAAVDASGEIYGAQSVLRRALTGLSLDPAEQKFEGSATTLQLVSQFALPGDAPEATAMDLSVDPCTEGHCLVLVLSRPGWSKQGAQTVATPLLRGIAHVAISYRGKGTDAQWQDAWAGDQGAPSLVRIDVKFAGRTARHWPTLYLATPGAS